MRTLTPVAAILLVCAGHAAQAHHEASALGTVTIGQPIRAGGHTLAAGTYEIRLTGEHLPALPGQSENAEQHVEFLSNGRVVAKDVATVIESDVRPVGTSGSTGMRVDLLRGGEFLRISTTRGNERYLIHLPLEP